MSKVSGNIKKYRLQCRLKQSELALMLGKSHNVISSWEAGTNRPDVDSIIKMCEIFQISANAFFSWEGIGEEGGLVPGEQAHIKKYRVLDDHGKEVVDYVLGLEHSRVSGAGRRPPSAPRARGAKPAPPPNGERAPRMRPLYEYPASAGSGAFVGYEECDLVELPHGAPDSVAYGVKIKGRSMEPNVPDGSIAWVRPQDDVDTGEICIVVIDDSGYCKIRRDGYFESLNPEYEDIRPEPGQSVSIKGAVRYVQVGADR